jgi:hypothetical protein
MSNIIKEKTDFWKHFSPINDADAKITITVTRNFYTLFLCIIH